jgi:transcriptional regulator with XRE-family HTH domain
MPVSFQTPEVGADLGGYIKKRRVSAGLSQAEVAERSGVARSNIAAIESGARKPSGSMASGLLSAISGESSTLPPMHLSPSLLINIEVSRLAAFAIARGPERSRETMLSEMRRLRAAADGIHSDHWLTRWDELLARWDRREMFSLLLSTDREAVDLRKVAPIRALLSCEEYQQAVGHARELWYATR